jgi:BirA family biotin operon repressor/biotin-[acetyl-CoA-carboxylase] ligase
MIERPRDASGLDVLSLRTGIGIAEALDPFAPEPIRLKWPNDLYVEGGKLGGILVEARWRESAVEWVAVGVGVNVRQPEDVPDARALDPGTARLAVLAEIAAAVRRAATSTGRLTGDEIEAFNARDMARGRRCTQPGLGRVAGISPTGEVLIELADAVASFRSGSLILEEGEGEPR